MNGWLLLLAGVVPAAPIDFDTQVVPILTKAGCNAGSCHGAATGRGGFRLSLFGGDASLDYSSIVEELKGRRVNLHRADLSLLLTKPTGSLRHEGGIRLDENGPDVKRLLTWIGEGAKRSAKARRLTHLKVEPQNLLLEELNTSTKLKAIARFDGGVEEDVSSTTVFSSIDPSAVEIGKDGQTVTIRQRGRHVVMAHFLDQIVPIQLTLPYSAKALDLAKSPRTNFIDDEVLRTLQLLRISPSGRATDAALVRRLRLDLTGRLPTPEEVNAYLADSDSNKWSKLVDRLLESEDFNDFWTYQLTKLVGNRPLPGEPQGALALREWIREGLRKSTPFDQTVRQLLTSTGDTHHQGAAYFTRLSNDPRAQAELVSQVFLGVRLQCANCHNHPLDRWTQDDYHGLAAVFAKLERGREVKQSSRGVVQNPRTGEPATPRLPGIRNLDAAADPRDSFAAWLTDQSNPYFARSFVNRLWKQMMGRGLVDPLDDLRDTNPATHPELLKLLASAFVFHNHDLRHTLRLIALSETYRRDSRPLPENRSDDRYYSHSLERKLEPEVVADALSDILGLPEVYGTEKVGTRAISLLDPTTPSRSLEVLGRCSRPGACDAATQSGNLATMLHRLNGEMINKRLHSSEGRLHRSIAAKKSTTEILDDYYLRSLARTMNDEERRFWLREESKAADRTAWLEDVVWSLLNSREFTNNH
jgi:hypothetical protein